jgi:GH24 family phage-related lysozyme (muramidase)
MSPKEKLSVNEALAAALLELDTRTAPNAVERPTPAIKAAVEALLAE